MVVTGDERLNPDLKSFYIETRWESSELELAPALWVWNKRGRCLSTRRISRCWALNRTKPGPIHIVKSDGRTDNF